MARFAAQLDIDGLQSSILSSCRMFRLLKQAASGGEVFSTPLELAPMQKLLRVQVPIPSL